MKQPLTANCKDSVSYAVRGRISGGDCPGRVNVRLLRPIDEWSHTSSNWNEGLHASLQEEEKAEM